MSSRPITTFTVVNIDQTGLAFLQVCVSTETVKVSGLVSRVGVQAIWFTNTERGDGVSGRGGTWCSGGLGWETFVKTFNITLKHITEDRINVMVFIV